MDTCATQPAELVPLLRFSHAESGQANARKSPDIKLVYKDRYEAGEAVPVSSLALSLNSCSLDLDPGLVDRTHLLLNYADLDPDCVRGSPAPPAAASNLTVTIHSPAVSLAFHVPKPDMRSPHDIGPEFIRTFWTRKVRSRMRNKEESDVTLDYKLSLVY